MPKPPKITERQLLITKRKLPHWQIGNCWFFVTFNLKDKNAQLSSEAKDVVAGSIKFAHLKRCAMSIGVVMPDHVHLLFQPLEKRTGVYFSLQEITGPVKSYSAHRINELMGRKGNLWLAESYDRIIRDEEEWLEKFDYIRNNPVKNGLAEKPEDYPWLIEREDFIRRH